MGELVFGLVLLAVAFFLRLSAATVRGESAASKPISGVLRILSYVALTIGVITVLGSTTVVINAGEVGVRHAFGTVDQTPLLAGVRFVAPWSSVERFSTREEQWPQAGAQVEEIEALSSEQMGMHVEVSIRWQIDPQQAPRIYTEIGDENQIRGAVLNAIRKGVRDGMVQYSINDIAKRTQIANTMEALTDSALVTQPRAGGREFRIATVTAFFLRDLQPPAQVVQAINNKIAQEQQVETERHRVEVARLQAEQQRLLNTTLTPEALMRQYLEVLRDMKSSNNLVILVPTQGGVPILNIGDLRRNLRQ
ncbi:MAG TPA: SPFH domain-containing protein [Gemmatimonadales bacterium]|jgi:regulator of protease activity HflC (stomatin/prohibitin superfamily)|nr:SPFH domain-containing protein [Gemmatimonadales bacterium]